MLEEIIRLIKNIIRINNRDYIRYFLKSHPIKNRFSIIIGQRGVSKTTAIIQKILGTYDYDIFTKKNASI